MSHTPLFTLNILIVDDEAPARLRMKTLLADVADECSDLPLQIGGEANNVNAALASLTSLSINVVLLDINMPEQTGLALAAELKQRYPNSQARPAIIFTTAYDEYALDAFALHAIDYLVKPVRAARLKEALLKARTFLLGQTPFIAPGNQLEPSESKSNSASYQPDWRTHFVVHDQGAIKRIDVNEVCYLKAEQKYVVLRTADREYLLEASLATLENELTGRYIRIHRNALVNLYFLSGIEKILMNNGEDADFTWVTKIRGVDDRLPISRRQLPLVREALER
ncbi:LytR/AlgR family response regulator transcription factor [Ampullimonas aquatilis]|uniref:LytR/AlgR family response regulator transcription factor n=1 Tax=Ampullimonas aquatilis TaxID=1341549 RepID=UPI003C7672BD